MVLKKTLESSLDCKEIQPVHPKGNQSWIFIGRTDAEAKLQYFGHQMWRTNSFEKTLMVGKIEGGRRKGWQRMRCVGGIADMMDMSLSRLWELVMDRESWHAAVHRITRSRTWLSDWTELNPVMCGYGQGLLLVFSWCSVRTVGICVYILDAFMEGDALHIPLLLCHLENTRLKLLNKSYKVCVSVSMFICIYML